MAVEPGQITERAGAALVETVETMPGHSCPLPGPRIVVQAGAVVAEMLPNRVPAEERASSSSATALLP